MLRVGAALPMQLLPARLQDAIERVSATATYVHVDVHAFVCLRVCMLMTWFVCLLGCLFVCVC
jgi:hypothetical protein